MKILNLRKRSRIALISLCLAASVLVPCLPAQSSMAAGRTCPDYLFIGARGSGQEYLRDTSGDYGVGTTVYSFYQHLSDDLYGSDLDIKLDPVPKPPYDATGINFTVGAGAVLHLPAAYEESARTIEPWVAGNVASELATCPGTKLILSGYSQGAQGVADALQRDINPSVVAGAAFFGDPYFNPRSPGDRGSFDPDRKGVLGDRPPYEGVLSGKVFSYCRNKDVICQGVIRYSTFPHPTTFDRSQHGEYATSGDPSETDTEMAADNVAALIRAEQASEGNTIEEPAPRSLSGPLDVAFAIDSTGSMGDIIESVKQNVAEIAAQMQSDDPDFRVALIDYKDAEPYSYGDPYQARVEQGFTSDLSEFDAAVQGLYAEGGGDTPESVYTGMMTALELPWRAGAHKELITIGDAGGHPEDPITGYTAADVVAKALSLDPVAVNGIPASWEAEETFESVAEETGGSIVPVEGEAAEAIIQSLQEAQTAPVAGLGEEPYEGFEDAPIILSASSSYSPSGRPLTYEWDFNDDGAVDETTATPVVEHTFSGGYHGLVTVRVVDDNGQSAVAQATVKAEGHAPPPPGTPGTPQVTSGDESVTATWSAPSSGGPVDLYELTNAEGAPEEIVVARGVGMQATTVEELPNGEVIQLAVTAVNGSGSASSGLSEPVTPEPPSEAGTQSQTSSSSSSAPSAAAAPSAKRHCKKAKKRHGRHHRPAACRKKHRHHRHRRHRSRHRHHRRLKMRR